MESNIKSSFIPQAPLAPQRPGARTSARGGFDLFILLGLVILIASGVLAVGVFLYAQYLNTSVSSKRASLERAKQAFEPALIQDLTRLDDRMKAADAILTGHVAPTILFHLLEQLTLQTVAFTSFDFATDEQVSLTMKGVAQSVNSIALQADLLSKTGIITNPIFSNINRQVNGVNFDFTAIVNPDALNYVSLVRAAVAPAAIEETPPPSSPFGTSENEIPNTGMPPQQ